MVMLWSGVDNNIILLWSPDIQPAFDPVMGRGSSEADLPGGAQSIKMGLCPSGRSCLWPSQEISHTWQDIISSLSQVEEYETTQ